MKLKLRAIYRYTVKRELEGEFGKQIRRFTESDIGAAQSEIVFYD